MSGLIPSIGSAPVRVLIAECTHMGNQLLAGTLALDDRFTVVATADDAQSVLSECEKRPDVLIMGINSEQSQGFELTRELRHRRPKVKIVALFDRSDRELVVEAFRSGARGVLCRAESIDSLRNCIRSVHDGQIWASHVEIGFVLEALADTTPRRVTGRFGVRSLSNREQQIVRFVAEGLTNRQIAAEMEVGEHAVKKCLLRIFEKLGVSSRAGLVFSALSRPGEGDGEGFGIVQLDDANDEAAFAKYVQAAQGPFPFAHLKVAEMYLEGRGAQPDPISALAWLLVAEEVAERVTERRRDLLGGLIAKVNQEQIADARYRASKILADYGKRFCLFDMSKRVLPPHTRKCKPQDKSKRKGVQPFAASQVTLAS